MRPLFITGTGTEVGKTLASAIIAESLHCGYWKPVQAGSLEGTDSDRVKNLLSNPISIIHPELYKLKLAASPHIAAREEGVKINLDAITEQLRTIIESPQYNSDQGLIIEGAGGLMVPLNEKEWVLDLIEKLNVPVLIVSRNTLGSINHSLLTAQVARSRHLEIMGWVFNDRYMNYESEIVNWTGIPALASIPFSENPDQGFVRQQAELIRPLLMKIL